jgi:hypothetical protein
MNPAKLAPFRIIVTASVAVLLLMGCAADSEPVPAAPTTAPTTAATTLTDSPYTATPVPSVAVPTATATLVPEPIQSPSPAGRSAVYPYGVVYAFSENDWSESDRQAIREHLEYLQGLGVNTIVQVFSSRLIGTGREEDWLILLDEAERVDMDVIARLWPLEDWTGQGFDFQPIGSFLSVVGGHPALLAYLGLHEPLEKFNSDQMRDFYAGVKDLAPDVPVAHYLGNMAWFEESVRFPNRDFTAGICDICIVWYTPVRYLDGEPAFEEDLFREILHKNRKLVDERAPDAQLWALGQTYAQQAHRNQLRMPTPEEMALMYTIAAQERMDGFLWYPWLHGSNYDQVLSDPDMDPQRQAVRHIYDTYVVQSTNP